MGYIFVQKNIRGRLGIEITGYEGSARFLEVPEMIHDLPVLSLGKHAFSGRRDLQEIRIPASVVTIGSFCFYDCQSLQKISLTDAVDDLGDGVIRECGSLQNIDVVVAHGSFRVVKEIMEDSAAELFFTIHVMDRGVYQLVIPAWHHEDREDTHARAIHPKIAGAGYAYRQTVTRTALHIREYDSLFNKAQTDGVRVAARIALYRLACPEELADASRETYLSYLQAHDEEVLLQLSDGNSEHESRDLLSVMLKMTAPSKEAVGAAIDRSSAAGRTEICSMLLAYEHDHFGSQQAAVFRL